MANKEMKTIQFPGSEIVYEIVDNAAREALAEKQPAGNYATTESLNAHTGNTNNPHGVTKTQVGLENVANERQYSSQNPPPYPVTSVAGRTGAVTLTKTDVGLSNVDNTSDTNKPVSTPQATAIAEAKKAGTDAQNAIDTHAENTSNPHNVTAAQVGAYVKPTGGIPETDLSAEVQEKLNSGGENLLKQPITVSLAQGSKNNLIEAGYKLGLVLGRAYKVVLIHNDTPMTLTGIAVIPNMAEYIALGEKEQAADNANSLVVQTKPDIIHIQIMDNVNSSTEVNVDNSVFYLYSHFSTEISHTVVINSITEDVTLPKIPVPTAADVGKILKVNANGEYELVEA